MVIMMIASQLCICVNAEGINPYNKNNMSTAITGGGYANHQGNATLGGWSYNSYACFKDMDFGEDGALSVTIGTAIGEDYGYPGIKVWAVDSLDDTDIIAANFNNVSVKTADGADKGAVLLGEVSGGRCLGWSTESCTTARIEKVTGIKTVILALSGAANLYSIQFNKTEAYDEKMFFDLDLSDYTNETPVAKNAVIGSSAGMAVYQDEVSKSRYPVMEQFATENGVKKYVVTASEDEAGNVTENGFINLYKEYGAVSAAADEISVEGWFRSDASVKTGEYRKIFNFGKNLYSQSANDDQTYMMFDVGDGKRYRARYSRVTYYNEMLIDPFVKGEWTHVVFTRSWDKDTSKWTSTVYVNGDLKGTSSAEGTHDEYPESNIQIGTSGNSRDKGFIGAVGDFKLYNTILTAGQVKDKYEAGLADYTPLSNDFDIINYKDYDEIDPFAQSLTLKFSNKFTKEEAERAVSFKKEIGDNLFEDINGGFSVEAEDETNTLTLRFGKLEKGMNYAVMFDGMKSVGGVELSANKLMLTTNMGAVYVDTDFSGLTPGDHPTAENTGLVFKSSGIDNSSDDIYVREKNGTNYIEINSTSSERKDSYAAYKFENTVTTPVKVEFGISGNDDTPNENGHLTRGIRLNLNGNYIFGMLNTEGTQWNTANTSASIKSNTTTTDSNGFFNLKYIFNASKTDGLTYAAYSEDDSNFYIEGANENIKGIDIISFQQYLSSVGNPQINLSRVRVTSYAMPEITASTPYGADRTVTYSFNDDIDVNTLDKVLITDASGSEIKANVDYDAKARKITIAFNNDLYINNGYTVSFANVMNNDGEKIGLSAPVQFAGDLIGMASDVVFTSSEGVMSNITDMGSNDTVTAAFTVANTALTAKNVTVILAFYEGDKFKTAAFEEKELAAGGNTDITVSVKTTAAEELTNGKIKLFIWDGMNSMKPVCGGSRSIDSDGVHL